MRKPMKQEKVLKTALVFSAELIGGKAARAEETKPRQLQAVAWGPPQIPQPASSATVFSALGWRHWGINE